MTGPPLYTMLPFWLACSGRLLFTLAGAPTRWRLCSAGTHSRYLMPLRKASCIVLCLRHRCAQWTWLPQARLHTCQRWTSSYEQSFASMWMKRNEDSVDSMASLERSSFQYIHVYKCGGRSERVRTANVSAFEIDVSRSRFSAASSGCARMHVSRQCRHLLSIIVQ